MEIVLRIIMLLCSAVAFVYGIVKLFKPKVAMFKQLVVCAVGCMMLGRLFEIVVILVRGALPQGFNVGMFGTIGGFMFICSASYGQMDGLVDDKSEALKKYRFISLAAPVIAVGITAMAFIFSMNAAAVWALVLSLFIGFALYFNLKHLIIPDIEFGIIDSIRGYSIVSMILGFAYIGANIFYVLEMDALMYVFFGIISVLYLVIIPVMERGSRKWTL